MKETFDWELTGSVIKKKLKGIKLSEDQPLFMVDMMPQERLQCLYSTQMLRTMNPDSTNLHNLSEAVSILTKEGRNQEEKRERAEIKEVLHDFFGKLKEKLYSLADSVASHGYQELSALFLPKNQILEFYESFLDGNLNNDEDFLRNFEAVVRISADSKKETVWTSEDVKVSLKECLNNSDVLCSKFEREINEIFKNPYKPFDGLVFPVLKSFKKFSQSQNNPMKTSITYGHGVDSNLMSLNYLSLSGRGHLVSKNILTDQDIFQLDLPGHGDNRNCCKFSKSAKKIGITSQSENLLLFYDANTGEKKGEISTASLRGVAFSCLWLDDEVFCVGYSNGLIRAFSCESLECISEVKVGNSIITTMEQNDEESLFAMDIESSVSLLLVKRKEIVFRKNRVHTGCNCDYKFALKRSFDGKSLVTSGDCDKIVKLLRIEDQAEVWARVVGIRVWGISWVPGDSYLIAMENQSPTRLMALSPQNGSILVKMELSLDANLVSMSVHLPTKMVLMGDNSGKIHKINIED